jgi:6-phosphogluconolactonase/glucosamine-6-phosphate isomerase/deaminase
MVHLAFQRCWLEGANFHGLLPHLENPDLNLVAVTKEYAELQVMPYLCLLGMGLDGHTASLFPGDKSSELGLLMDSPDVIFTQAPSHPVQRISVSLPVVQRAKQVYVLFSGEDKKQVWLDAKVNQTPISLVQETCSNLEVYFTK